MLCVLIILSLVGSFFDFGDNTDLFSFLSSVILSVLFAEKLSVLLSAVISSVKVTSGFVTAFIPAFTLLVSFSGSAATAVSYNAVALGVCEIISAFLNYGFLTFIGSYFALLVSFSLGSMNLSRFINSFNRAVNLALGFTSSMFAGFLSLKNIFSYSADSLAARGTRFLLGSLIPVIGPSVSEAYSSFLGSINLLKSSFGIVGILAVILINIPILTEGMIYYLMLCFLSCVGEVLGCAKASELLRGFSSCVRILLLVGLLEAFIFIISAGILLTVRGG